MKRCKCGICGSVFKSKTDKKKHKKEYLDGSCEKLAKVEDTIKRKSPIQKVDKIMIPKEQAKEEWKKYCKLLKTRKDKHLEVLKTSMYYAKQGKQLIDIYQVMKKAGLNSKREPRLAIARADLTKVQFQKRDTGTGRFNMSWGWDKKGRKYDVELPQKIFNVQWERNLDREGRPAFSIKNESFVAKVPVIPADLMPEGKLENYYILWEVKEWEQLPKPKDPFLLKRISQNLFVILAVWDLTELEISIMGGRT